MIKKYKTRSIYDLAIEEVEIERETENCVFYVPVYWGKNAEIRRENKSSDYHCYHNTWEDAHQFLIHRKNIQLMDLMKKVEDVEKEINALTDMKQ